MNYHFPIAFLFLSFSLFAQKKGASPIPNTSIPNTQQQTYAVVVGISDYQDEGIPDLRFADKDAEAFANFLRSPAGGSLDEDHLVLLLNEDATLGQFGMALTWLMEVCQENDKAIIYFSGHGDVENKSVFEPGFLLCWDAPAKAYLSGGTFSLANLKVVISSLSVGNNAEVVVITDACRSGKLSGSSIGGTQATAANLAQQFANETKILSCQPDEYSIEGEQWGGGRGAFSYHLINALYGMADRNADQKINLSELDRYLEDNVTPEVAPISQIPSVIGSKTTLLSSIDPAILQQLMDGNSHQKTFAKVESKGLEEDVLAGTDSLIQSQYLAFKKSLKERIFLSNDMEDASGIYVDTLYGILTGVPELEPLYSTMKRNYAAALIESSQQFMNGLTKSDPSVCSQENRIQIRKLKKNVAYLERSLELLGEEHYMYKTLLAFKYFFEGDLMSFEWGNANEGVGQDYNPTLGKEIIDIYHEALKIQSGLPPVYLSIANRYSSMMNDYDSAHHYANLALDAVPEWLYAHVVKAQIYFDQSDFKSSAKWRDKVWEMDTTALLSLSYHGDWYRERGEEEKAMIYYEKAVEAGTPVYCDYIWLKDAYINKLDYNKAEFVMKKAELLGENLDQIYTELMRIYSSTGDKDKLAEIFQKIKSMKSNNEHAYQITAISYYMDMEMFDKAKDVAFEILEKDPENQGALNTAAFTLLTTKEYNKAGQLIERGLELNPNYAGLLSAKSLRHICLGQYDLAEKIIKELHPENYERKGRLVLELALIYSLKNEPQEARLFVEKAFKESDEYQKRYFLNTFGKMYRSLGFSREILPVFNLMIEADPNELRTYIEMAATYDHLGETIKAMDAIETAMDKGFSSFPFINKRFNGSALMSTPRWKTMEEKYFMNQFKD